MDYIAFCRQFYATTGIPTVLYQDGVLRYSALAELLGSSRRTAGRSMTRIATRSLPPSIPIWSMAMCDLRGAESTCFWGRSLPRRSQKSCCT